MWIKGWVEKSVEKRGLSDTVGGEGRWQAPREADSNMQHSKAQSLYCTALQSEALLSRAEQFS